LMINARFCGSKSCSPRAPHSSTSSSMNSTRGLYSSLAMPVAYTTSAHRRSQTQGVPHQFLLTVDDSGKTLRVEALESHGSARVDEQLHEPPSRMMPHLGQRCKVWSCALSPGIDYPRRTHYRAHSPFRMLATACSPSSRGLPLSLPSASLTSFKKRGSTLMRPWSRSSSLDSL
jgi:hypothetical protein